jgi:hypothetical protein
MKTLFKYEWVNLYVIEQWAQAGMKKKSPVVQSQVQLVIAWGCHRYIRSERCRSNKVKYEKKEGEPHNLLNGFGFEWIILASLMQVTNKCPSGYKIKRDIWAFEVAKKKKW